MHLKAISFQGFRSFEGEEVIDIPDTPGVYLITGENKVDSKLGANGVGKSSFADGLCYCLYGKTSKGHRAKDIGNWTGEHLTIVSAEFEADGEDHIITRRWNPNSLIHQRCDRKSKTVDDAAVVDVVGMDYKTFLATVLFAQGGECFMDKGSTAQAQALSQVLNLDVWEDRSKSAKRIVGEAEEYKREREDNLLVFKAQKKALIEQYNSLCDREDAWEDEQAKTEKDLINQLDASDVARVNAETAYAETSEIYKCHDESYNDARHEARNARDGIENFEKSRSRLIIEHTALITRGELLARSAKQWGDVIESDGDACLTCGQEITEKMARKEFDSFQNELTKLQREVLATKVKKDKFSARISKMKAEVERLIDLREKANDLANDAQACQIAAHSKLSVAKRITKRILELVEDLRKDKNPHTAAIDEINEKLNQLKSFIRIEKKEIKVQAKVIDRYGYWIKGYLAIRLWKLDRAMDEFAAKMNSSCEQLGLNGWEVFCETVKKVGTKGELKPAFNIMATSPNSPHPVPWGIWSGGEEQRLRLAGNAAFSDLVCDRLGVRPSLEIWDEPTQHLSSQGCDDLMEFFKYRSRVLNKQVWVIDHRTLHSGDIDGHWHFIKDDTGTHIQAA